MSRIAKAAVAFVALAGAVVAVVAYWQGRDSTDAQEALVVPFIIFWTIVALVLVWMLDGFIRALHRYFARRR